MNNIPLSLTTYYIVAVLMIILVLNLMQIVTRRKYKKDIDNLEREKNVIIDSSIMTELSKAGSIIKNEKLRTKYQVWETDIDYIKKNMITDINDLILEADFLIDQKDFNGFYSKKIKTELRIYEANEKKNKIYYEIQQITSCEDRNRDVITGLKSRFREILQNFEASKSDFGDLESTVKLQIENIGNRFQEFEQFMENQEYDEVVHIVSSLDSMINHMETIIEELPSAVLMANNLIPKRIEEVNFNYKKLLADGYQLDYLNIEYNISEIEKKVSDINSRIRVLNLEEVLFELKTMLEYFDNIYNDFERERMAKKTFEDQILSFKSKISKINDVMNKLYGKVVDVKYNYALNDSQLEVLSDLSNELETINKDFDVLYETKKTISFPYTRLVKELDVLMIRLSKTEERIDKYTQNVGNMQDDEKRAREQLSEISVLLKNAKYKIRDYKLPVIPNNYFVELKEAIEALKEITKELEKKPMDIDVLNTRVDTARDLVFKFYNTTNEIMKTAMMAESAIIYGNRYKTNKQYVEEGLNKAEILFIKGEYKKSLELTLNTIDIIEPGIHKKLLELYEYTTDN